MSIVWVVLLTVGFGLVIGLAIGGAAGFLMGYDWAADDLARLADRPARDAPVEVEKQVEVA